MDQTRMNQEWKPSKIIIDFPRKQSFYQILVSKAKKVLLFLSMVEESNFVGYTLYSYSQQKVPIRTAPYLNWSFLENYRKI